MLGDLRLVLPRILECSCAPGDCHDGHCLSKERIDTAGQRIRANTRVQRLRTSNAHTPFGGTDRRLKTAARGVEIAVMFRIFADGVRSVHKTLRAQTFPRRYRESDSSHEQWNFDFFGPQRPFSAGGPYP
eukprot:gene18637-biopygen11475